MFTVGCFIPCAACGIVLIIVAYQSSINMSDSVQQSNLEFVPIVVEVWRRGGYEVLVIPTEFGLCYCCPLWLSGFRGGSRVRVLGEMKELIRELKKLKIAWLGICSHLCLDTPHGHSSLHVHFHMDTQFSTCKIMRVSVWEGWASEWS